MQLQVGKIYTFNTKAPSLLGITVERARLKSISDFDNASKQQQLWLQYQNVLPALPPGTPTSPRESIYYHFETEAGELLILSEFWIDFDSAELIVNTRITIDVPTANPQDATRIRDALNALGITGYTLSVS